MWNIPDSIILIIDKNKLDNMINWKCGWNTDYTKKPELSMNKYKQLISQSKMENYEYNNQLKHFITSQWRNYNNVN